MAAHTMGDLKLDARPDRIDFRDRPYRPPLVSLPESFPPDEQIAAFFPQYLEHKVILDQKSEGACTGFGLAAVINYIYWDRWARQEWSRSQADPKNGATGPADHPASVSPYMLYDLARVYDEWVGEAYSGSSCRGALKGWHKHGVCDETLWRDAPDVKKRPDPDWRKDAAQRPLGAYYRVNAASISDIQAAIHEVRAVYCSARVHTGWKLEGNVDTVAISNLLLPIIPFKEEITGGHAFALVGYNRRGFIVQNSWGKDWGENGFGILTYEDWAENGNDVWVAALAGPMEVSNASVPVSKTDLPLSVSVPRNNNNLLRAGSGNSGVTAWTAERASTHSLIMGNDGNVIWDRIDTADADDNLKLVALDEPFKAIKKGAKRIVIYAHGGLNSEKAGIKRAMNLGPWFEANGIYPIFIVWRTGFWDAIGNIGGDFADRFLAEREDMRADGIGDIVNSAVKRFQDRFDTAFELAAENTIGKPIWTQIKQNAEESSKGSGGMRKLAKQLGKLHAKVAAEGKTVDVHLMGHSAGAVLLGHMLGNLGGSNPVASVNLFAPACSMEFAERIYGRALDRGTIPNGRLAIHNLSDENERGDTVGPYGKSLLYLVCRALETTRKNPLLGLAKALEEGNSKLAAIDRNDLHEMKQLLGADFDENQIKHIAAWRRIAAAHNVVTTIHGQAAFPIKIEGGEETTAKPTHGGLDNHIGLVNAVFKDILSPAALSKRVTDLTGF